MPRKKKEAPTRADKRYEVKITVGTRPNGTLMRKSFYSSISKADAERQAKEWEVAHKAEELLGDPITAPNVKFKTVAREFLQLKENDANLREYSYITTYETAMNKYIIPYFGDRYVKHIKPIDIERFFVKHSSMSQSMVHKFKLCLNGVFELAIDNDIIYKNPVKKNNIRGKKPKIKETYTLEERTAIIDYCRQYNYVSIVLLLELGIRRSELLGLKWEDVDIGDRCVSINKGVTPTRHSFNVSDTKSDSSYRKIPCSEDLTNFLLENKSTGYVLKGKTGQAMAPSTFSHYYKVSMTKICDALGIKYLPPHNLRHTVGTLMHEGGTDIYTISKYLGHSDVGITSKTYVKTNVDALRKNIKY